MKWLDFWNLQDSIILVLSQAPSVSPFFSISGFQGYIFWAACLRKRWAEIPRLSCLMVIDFSIPQEHLPRITSMLIHKQRHKMVSITKEHLYWWILVLPKTMIVFAITKFLKGSLHLYWYRSTNLCIARFCKTSSFALYIPTRKYIPKDQFVANMDMNLSLQWWK